MLVLIAEGDAANRSELKILLDLYGISVLEAENGEEMIDLTVRQCPDLVLINVELPKLDGDGAVRLIRNIKSFESMPVIFYSDNTERAFRKRAFAVGGNGFHIAPLDIERLDLILENFLFCAGEKAKIYFPNNFCKCFQTDSGFFFGFLFLRILAKLNEKQTNLNRCIKTLS